MSFEDLNIGVETYLTSDVGWTGSVFGHWCIEGCKDEKEVVEVAYTLLQDAFLKEHLRNP